MWINQGCDCVEIELCSLKSVAKNIMTVASFFCVFACLFATFLEGWSYLGTYLLTSEIIYAMLVAVWWSFSDPAFPPFAWFSQAGTLNTINYFKLFSIKRFSVLLFLLLIQKNMSRPEHLNPLF